MNNEWQTVSKAAKKAALTARREGRRQEISTQSQLLDQNPHIVVGDRVPLGVDGLKDKFASQEWIELQLSGWKFVRVIKPNDPSTARRWYEDILYKELPVNNRWGDTCLFTKML